MSGINAGDLDREITLVTGVKTQDAGTGEEVIVWDADAPAAVRVWAQWLPAGTREAWNAQRSLGSFVQGVWKIYVVSPVPTPDGTRIVGDDGRIYDVTGVVEVGRGDAYEISVTARGEGNG